MASNFGDDVNEEYLRFSFGMLSDEMLTSVRKELLAQTKMAVGVIDDILAGRRKVK